MKRFTTDEIEFVIYMYKKGESMANIAKTINRCLSSVSYVLNRFEIKKRSQSKSSRTYSVNDNYFDKIDSNIKAYFLGLLYADGNVYVKNGKNVMTLQLKESDSAVLDVLVKDIESNNPIKTITSNYIKLNGDNSISRALIINNKKICQDLIKNGCVIRKSLLLKSLPDIDNKYKSHFIRGYFDGDGSVSKLNKSVRIAICGTYDFLLDMKSVLSDNNINPLHINKTKNIYELSGASRETMISLKEYLYKDSDVHIERKYKIFNLIT